jgi:hypothetical protein
MPVRHFGQKPEETTLLLAITVLCLSPTICIGHTVVPSCEELQLTTYLYSLETNALERRHT